MQFEGPRDKPLTTLTHARLRVEQGDLAGAREILDRLLAVRPNDAEARHLLRSLRGGPSGRAEEPVEPVPRPPEARDPARLADRFRRQLGGRGEERPAGRVEVLREWIGRIVGPAGGCEEREAEMLDQVLERVNETVSGSRAVLLVGMDGVIAAACSAEGVSSWEWIAASYTELLRQAGSANREARMDPPTELLVASPSAILVFRQVTPEYALLAALDPESGSLGRARYELRKASDQLLPELE